LASKILHGAASKNLTEADSAWLRIPRLCYQRKIKHRQSNGNFGTLALLVVRF